MFKNDKKKLREDVRIALAALSEQGRVRQSETIFEQVAELDAFRAARTVAVYHSLPDEPSTTAFIEKWQQEKDIVLPCVVGERMIFRRLSDTTQTGCFGICEPTGDEVPPDAIDLMIVPGVAFDREGHRLGRGKGFYDKYLSGTAIPRVGVCFAVQLRETLPREAHDQRMDMVIVSS